MELIQTTYMDVRDKIRPGDVIAFSGNSSLSSIIRWSTRSNVSHIGAVIQMNITVNNVVHGEYVNQLIESADVNGFLGVSISRLSHQIENYEGEVWWLPLSEETRSSMNVDSFCSWMISQEGKEYDVPQAIGSAIDDFDEVIGLTKNVEDFTKFFCSELVAAGLEQSGAISELNASEVTPIDLCMFSIYSNTYYQLKGVEKKLIRGYNSISPRGWGV